MIIVGRCFIGRFVRSESRPSFPGTGILTVSGDGREILLRCVQQVSWYLVTHALTRLFEGQAFG